LIELLQLFKGESVTWVLTIAMLIGLFFLGKFIKDVFNNMLKETKDLQAQIKEDAAIREKQLKDELAESRKKSEEERSEFIEQLKENTKATNEIVSTLKEMNFRIENIEKKV
jgi:F0F1-type ATP synthase membrane subunit b/b'